MSSTTTTEENEEIVRRLLEDVMIEGNVDPIDEDVIDHTPLGDTRGREAIKGRAKTLHAGFPTSPRPSRTWSPRVRR